MGRTYKVKIWYAASLNLRKHHLQSQWSTAFLMSLAKRSQEKTSSSVPYLLQLRSGSPPIYKFHTHTYIHTYIEHNNLTPSTSQAALTAEMNSVTLDLILEEGGQKKVLLKNLRVQRTHELDRRRFNISCAAVTNDVNDPIVCFIILHAFVFVCKYVRMYVCTWECNAMQCMYDTG